MITGGAGLGAFPLLSISIESEIRILLSILDNAWKDNLHSMDQIRDSIGFRAFSQKDPRIEFKRESAKTFNEMQETIRDRVTDVAFLGRLMPQIPRAAPRPQPAQPPFAALRLQQPLVLLRQPGRPPRRR